MSRLPKTFDIPQPRDRVLQIAPTLTVAQAVAWLNELGPQVTARYIGAQTDKGELPCAVIGGRRYYSEQNLWDFILTRGRTARARTATNERHTA